MNNNIDSQFQLPLSDRAFQEYQQSQQLIWQIQAPVDQKIVGTTSRATQHTHPLGFITYLLRMFIHPEPSFGYGTQIVPTK
jgi:hypothetical protein